MEGFKDEILEKSLNLGLKKLPISCEEDFNSILKLFEKGDVFFMGGFVRDNILKALYDYSFPTNDLDILISDWNFDKKVKSLGKMDSPRFGGLKFEYENFSMDVFGLKNIFLFE